MKKTYILRILYYTFWISWLFSIKAYAYIDPTTTAMLTQIIAGVFISLGVVIGVFRRKIGIFFKNIQVKMLQKKIEKNKKNEK